MPRTVDHEKRRAEISSATWRVIEREGLSGVTLRSVASEAGVSLGVLSHYFRSKDDILVAADRMAFDRALGRVMLKTMGQHGLQALENAILEALPLDSDRRLEAQIDIAFIGMCLTHPELARRRQASVDALRTLIRACLVDARQLGQLRDDVDDALVADECLSLIDGASTLGILNDDDTNNRARLTRLARAFVARLRVSP